jgi:hypothetical protein
MDSSAREILCDGCGLPASQEHIAARIRRLELATQFRPIHIGILFVSLAPPLKPEDDFYAPAASREFSDPFLEGLEISVPGDTPLAQIDAQKLVEFQRRGYFLSCLSECPMPAGADVPETIRRQASDLVRRIRFNYKPKQVALLGMELAPVVEVLASAGIGPSLILNQGLPLPFPGTGPKDWKSLFFSALASASTSQNPQSGYDRIYSNLEVSNPGAGGGT